MVMGDTLSSALMHSQLSAFLNVHERLHNLALVQIYCLTSMCEYWLHYLSRLTSPSCNQGAGLGHKTPTTH